MLHPIPHRLSNGAPAVELRGVSCGYGGSPVIHDVDLKLMPGDFVGLLGPSGSGKTTLLRAILGAVDVYQGDVIVQGVSTSRGAPRIGYVPQLKTIDWNFPVTVEETVMMGLTMFNPLFPWNRRRDREVVTRMLERLSIDHLRKRHIRELSGGQQQRVFVARALVSNPSLLLLDEPTTGNDIKTRDEFLHLLHELNHHGVTIIMTTHEINAVAAHLPWVVCLNERILASGPPSEVFTQETFKLTYNAEMPVIKHMDMTLVGESPHHMADAGPNGNRTTADTDPAHSHVAGSEHADPAHSHSGDSGRADHTHAPSGHRR